MLRICFRSILPSAFGWPKPANELPDLLESPDGQWLRYQITVPFTLQLKRGTGVAISAPATQATRQVAGTSTMS